MVSRKAEDDEAGVVVPCYLIGAIRRGFFPGFLGLGNNDPWKLQEIVIRCTIQDSRYSEIDLRCQGSDRREVR